MGYTLHKNDLPANVALGNIVAIDTETMGLNPLRERLCLIQLSSGDGNAHLVAFDGKDYSAPNLRKLLSDKNFTSIFHFARFDVAVLKHYLDVDLANIYCTKIASKLVRTYTDKHGLKDICKELLSVDLSKHQQSSDWGNTELTTDQCNYAASDVLHLHKLKEKLDAMLERTGRADMAKACFNFLPTRAALDLKGWEPVDIFAHS